MAASTYKGFTWSHTTADTTTSISFVSLEPTTGVTHSWNFGDGTTSTLHSPNKTYTADGVYDVTYTCFEGEVAHRYFQKRAVRVYKDRSRAANYTIDLSTVVMDGRQHDYSYIPAGSYVKLTGSNANCYRYILKNLRGTAAAKIHVYATGGVLTGVTNSSGSNSASRVIYNNCEHVIMDCRELEVVNGGTDTWNQCTDIEQCFRKLSKGASSGFKCKSDGEERRLADGTLSPWYRNMWFHNTIIEEMYNEGIYAGWSFYYKRDHDAYYRHAMKGCKIWRCNVYRCGWDALQIGSGDEDCEMHDNYCEHNATLGKASHAYGIQINSGFKGEVYNNITVEGSNACGGMIQFQPGFNSKIYNNFIYAPNAGFGLFIKTESNEFQTEVVTDANLEVQVFGNTIINTKNAIYVIQSGANGTPAKIKKLVVKNNIHNSANFLEADGIHAPTEVVQANNIAGTLEAFKFVDPSTGNLRILSGSTAIDTGGSTGIEASDSKAGAYDIDGVERVSLFDAGGGQYSPKFAGGEPDPQPPLEAVVRNKKLKLVV